MWFLNSSDTKRARYFRIYEEEEPYYPCSETKGADQLRDVCVCLNELTTGIMGSTVTVDNSKI